MCNSHDDKELSFFFLTCNIGFQEPSEIRLLTRFPQMNISVETTPCCFSDTWNSCSPRSEELIHIAKVTGFCNKLCEAANTCGQHWEILTLAEDLTALLEGLLHPDHSVSFPLKSPTFPVHGDLFFLQTLFIQPDYQLPHHHHMIPMTHFL